MTRKRKNSGEVSTKATQMVKDISEEVEEVEIEVESKAIVSAVVANCGAVNVRASARKDAEIIFVAKVNTPFHVLEKGTKWSLVDGKDLPQPGYVMNEFLKVVK